MLNILISRLTRKKRDVNPVEKIGATPNRVLGLADLTALGVGSTLGLGVYVLAGHVARYLAGPATCISFLIAAIASALAGLCYSEFAARVPKGGSAYVYSYVCIGEFVAFVIGWNMTLEYIIGTASLATGLSIYIDTILDNAIQNYLLKVCPINVPFLGQYPDIVAFCIVVLLIVILSIGIKESSTLNNFCTSINMLTILIVITAGIPKINLNNWFIEKKQIPNTVVNAGEGGFLPFGVSGIVAGAAKCFFAFVGFDGIATTSEESKNPQRHIPLSIILSLIIAFFSYFGISTILTLIWPYYDQNPDAPFTYVFSQLELPLVKWLVTGGAIFSLCAALLGVMIPMPRIIFSMAEDGLFFKTFSNIHHRFKTPMKATVVFGFFSAVMALIFNLQVLIDMMSIGTLMAYTIVAICVITLRYDSDKEISRTENFIRYKAKWYCEWFNTKSIEMPTSQSSKIVKYSMFCYCASTFVLGFMLVHYNRMISLQYSLFLITCIISALVLILSFVIMCRQPKNYPKLFFKVPWVPFFPCLCVFINIYLMLELDTYTWIRFSIWMTIGLLIYFTYSLKHSKEAILPKDEVASIEASNN